MPDGLLDGQRAALLDEAVERPALDVLHDDEVELVGLADVVDADDVGMVQGGGGAALAVEPLQGADVLDLVRREDLQRDLPLQTRMLREVDRAHAALAERAEQAVRPQEEAAMASRLEMLEVVARQQPRREEGVRRAANVHG